MDAVARGLQQCYLGLDEAMREDKYFLDDASGCARTASGVSGAAVRE